MPTRSMNLEGQEMPTGEVLKRMNCGLCGERAWLISTGDDQAAWIRPGKIKTVDEEGIVRVVYLPHVCGVVE